jgi:hypothetical protein
MTVDTKEDNKKMTIGKKKAPNTLLEELSKQVRKELWERKWDIT